MNIYRVYVIIDGIFKKFKKILKKVENDIGLINIPVNHKKILVVFPKKKCDGACAQVRM